ncbi:S8 family serine peptidase, partial [bacterium]|nr:S8 family serine peptidase [bacterium]
ENVLVVVSGGNEGPGLSSSGNPSCAERILSVAAMLPEGSARDSYGFANDGDRVFHFNSRGGEADKPDCAAPGAASSSVPMHAKGENMWGTSMACPQAAGAAAVLISACIQQDIPWNGALIKRALKQSARPIPGYTRLDQGTGVINIPAAFEILKMYASLREAEKVLDYEIRTLSPNALDQKGPAVFWRTGTYFPADYKKQTVTVKAIFPRDIKADDKAVFYRAFNLKADQPWIKTDKSSTYIRGEGEARIGIYFKRDLMKQPGLYTGVVSAFPKSGPGVHVAEFQIPVTVIVPHLPSESNSYSFAVNGKTLKSGQNHRYFVQVPPGASAMHIEIAASSGRFSGIECYVFDPEGVEKGHLSALDPESREPKRLTIGGKRLKPGIWELIPLAFHNVAKPSTYDLSVRFDGLETVPDTVTVWTYESGEKPRGRITAVSRFGCFSGSAEGIISGYRKTEKQEFLADKNHVSFGVDEGTRRVDFEMSVSRETWGLFTDLAVNILDENDVILKDESMTNRSLNFSFFPKKPGKYTLEIWAGFALPENDGELWEMDLTMTHLLNETIPVSVEFSGKDGFEIFPDVPAGLEFKLEKAPRVPPAGCGIWGEIRFRDDATGRTAAVTPLYIRY